MEGEIAEYIDGAVATAAAAPAVRPADVFDNVYANPPERVLRHRRELVGPED